MEHSSEVNWERRGNCWDTYDDLFFPSEGYSSELKAAHIINQKYCKFCPVKAQCLSFAIRFDSIGIWAGTTTDTRKKIRSRRNRLKCPDCQNKKLVTVNQCKMCLSCGISWEER